MIGRATRGSRRWLARAKNGVRASNKFDPEMCVFDIFVVSSIGCEVKRRRYHYSCRSGAMIRCNANRQRDSPLLNLTSCWRSGALITITGGSHGDLYSLDRIKPDKSAVRTRLPRKTNILIYHAMALQQMNISPIEVIRDKGEAMKIYWTLVT